MFNISPLLDVGFVKTLSQSVDYRFLLLIVHFSLQKLCNLMGFHLSILDLRAQGILFKKIFPCAHVLQGVHHYLFY